jgi:prepilin-type N-terminal cleavage/methylation domain-containing protein
MLKIRIDRRGFTLLELLIAIAVFGAIVAVLYPAYTGTFRNIEAAESQSEMYHMARTALERMASDLQCAYLPEKTGTSPDETDDLRVKGFLGLDETLDGRNADGLRFTSEEHILFHEEGRKGRGQIIYYVKQKDGEDSWILFRSDTSEFENPPDEETGGFVIFDGLQSIDITYQDEEGETHESWDSSKEPFKDKLPYLVSIQLEAVPPSGPESPLRFQTSVFLPMAGSRP